MNGVQVFTLQNGDWLIVRADGSTRRLSRIPEQNGEDPGNLARILRDWADDVARLSSLAESP